MANFKLIQWMLSNWPKSETIQEYQWTYYVGHSKSFTVLTMSFVSHNKDQHRHCYNIKFLVGNLKYGETQKRTLCHEELNEDLDTIQSLFSWPLHQETSGTEARRSVSAHNLSKTRGTSKRGVTQHVRAKALCCRSQKRTIEKRKERGGRDRV